ncbi:hypothetical protein QZH41_001821 [Actinostola sp. cb2023]|nr:hypothetical protein QZH41_001821 [Actinostola sp. cb2023]
MDTHCNHIASNIAVVGSHSHVDVITRLRTLTKDLIYLRTANDKDPVWVSKVDNHYNNLQRLLQEIEHITGVKHAAVKMTKRETGQSSSQGVPDVVCPEIYLGTTFGYPFYYNGFQTSNCSVKVPVEKLVTLIFDKAPVAMRTDQGEVVADQLNFVDRLVDFINSLSHDYPDIDPTKARLAYGDRALPKLNRELNSPDLKTRQKALMSLCDVMHNPECICEGLRVGHAPGRDAFLDHGIILPLSELFNDNVYQARRNSHKAIEMCSHTSPGTDGVVEAKLVSVLVNKLLGEEDDIKVME